MKLPEAWQTLPRRGVRRCAEWSLRARWWVLLASVLLTAGALYYTVGHLNIDTDTTDMIDVRLPHRQANLALANAFPHLPGDVVVYTESARAGHAEEAADALVARLRERQDIAKSWSQPGGGEFFARNGLLYLSVDELWSIDKRLTEAAPMLGPLALDPSLHGLFETLRLTLEHPADDSEAAQLGRLYTRVTEALIAPKAAPIHWRDELSPGTQGQGPQRAFVLIDPAREQTSFQPEEQAVSRLHALIAELGHDWPDVRFGVTGPIPMNGEELETVGDDATLTTLLSFGLVAVVLLWGLRSPSVVLAVLVTLACGLVWTAALATLLVGSLNIISVCFAVLFIGMGVDFGIQYAMRYLEECDRGLEGQAAVLAAGEGVGSALTLAAVGAALCFATFVPTSYRGLAQLGVISSFSMGVALLANITLLPALLSFLRAPHARLGQREQSHAQFARRLARHSRPILIVSALLALASAVLLPKTAFDPNPVNLKDRHSPAVQAFLALAMDPVTSPYTIEILSPSLKDADALAARLSQLPTVDKVVTLTSLVPEGQEEKLGIIEGLRASLTGVIDVEPVPAPGEQAEVAALVRFSQQLEQKLDTLPAAAREPARKLAAALHEVQRASGWPARGVPELRLRLLGDLPATLKRLRLLLEAEKVTLESLPADLRARYLAPDARARLEVFPRENLNDNAAMRRFVKSVQAAAPAATGAPVELVIGSEVVMQASVEASLGALGLTLLLHVLVLHGWLEALLVAAPLVLAMLLTMATSVLAHFPLNFANIIALPLLIGLNNAYGAYLVVRRQHTGGVHDLMTSSTPRAVMFSGMTAVASFGTLAVSKHPGMAGMGILIALSLAYALISALVMLPALMHAVERWTHGNNVPGAPPA